MTADPVTSDVDVTAPDRAGAAVDSAPSDLPSGWAWTTLGDLLCSIEAGKSFKCEERPPREGETGVVKVSAVTWGEYNELESKTCSDGARIDERLLVQPGDFLFSRANTIELVGACVIARHVTKRLMLSDKILRLRLDGVEQDWMLWVLRSRHGRSEIETFATGNQLSMRNISQENIRRIRVPLPPLAEQRRIVEAIEQHFTRLDAGVAALKRAQVALKRYRAAVLKAAVEGRLTAAWRAAHPDVEPASRLLARILAERRACWEADLRAKGKDPAKARYDEPKTPDTASLPVLPEGWCWASLGQVVIFQNGRAFPSSQYRPQGVRLLRPGNLFADGSVRWTESNTRYLPESWAESQRDLIVRGDELIMNLTAQSLKDEFLGRICLTSPDEYCLLNQRLARITPVPNLDRRYVLYMLKSHIFRGFVDNLNKGSLIQHMFTSQLDAFCFPLPPLPEQQTIVAEVERRLSVVAELEATIAANLKRAERLRQSILKRAFAGRLVPQSPDDEPASALLERIRQEREAARAAKAGGKAREPTSGRLQQPGASTRAEESSTRAGAGVAVQQETLWQE